MDTATLLFISVTVFIHAIGIGFFLVWFALGRPTSIEAFKARWKKSTLLPRWR